MKTKNVPALSLSLSTLRGAGDAQSSLTHTENTYEEAEHPAVSVEQEPCRAAIYAIAARAYRLNIKHLHAHATLEAVMGEHAPPLARLVALIAATLEDESDEIDCYINQAIYDCLYEVGPALWQDNGETDLEAIEQLREAYTFCARRLLAQNACARKAIYYELRNSKLSIKGKQANSMVDIAMGVSEMALKYREI